MLHYQYLLSVSKHFPFHMLAKLPLWKNDQDFSGFLKGKLIEVGKSNYNFQSIKTSSLIHFWRNENQ